HHYYLVNNCFPMDRPIWVPPPRLRNYKPKQGIGYFIEKDHAFVSGQLYRKISIEDPIKERKSSNTLEG
ncbi:hypothetical protein PJP08_29500, partial [Mycobacterium kansasii]